jgi:hypothetical protein
VNGDLDRHLPRAGQHDHHRATHHDPSGDDRHGEGDDHDAAAQAGHHDRATPTGTALDLDVESTNRRSQ